jgi:hypothetical protein
MIRRMILLTFLCACAALPALHAQSLFWLENAYGAPKLGSANADGSHAQSIPLPPGSLPEGLSLSPGGSDLYWSELAFTGARIMTAHASLTGIAVLDTGGSAERGVACDSAGAKLYWAASNLVVGGMILRSDLDGTHKELLQSFAPGTANPRAVAIDHSGGKVYWTDFDGGTIQRAGLTPGAPIENLVGSLKGPVGLALDLAGGKMYWTEAGRGAIKKGNLDGTSSVTLDSNLAIPNYLALDVPRGTMYWTALGTPGIWRANMNGTQVQNLNITVTNPGGIAVIPGSTTSISVASPVIPSVFVLSQNFPNPFNPTSTIRYGLPQRSSVILTVFNSLGQQIERLVNDIQDAGYHDVRFDGSALASGVYFYRIQAGSFSQTRHLLLLR